MKKYTIGIVGGAGFTGGELTRLLIKHSAVELVFSTSRSLQGKPIYEVHKDLIGETDLKFTDSYQKVDLIFLCLPHGESKKWLNKNQIGIRTKIIDLGNDFRLENKFKNKSFVYGLSELNRQTIKKANSVSNPGCFATAIQLALLPLVQQGEISEVYTTGITGSTGAGQQLMDTTNFNWRNNNISAYKTLTHQHLLEIKKTFKEFGQRAIDVNFVPWRGDFTRGIFTSSIIKSNWSPDELKKLYQEYYEEDSFVHVSDTPIDLKQVVNTNKCLIYLEGKEGKVVVHSAIDNLIKGASGQAIQNMNLMFGLSEDEGLKLKSIVY